MLKPAYPGRENYLNAMPVDAQCTNRIKQSTVMVLYETLISTMKDLNCMLFLSVEKLYIQGVNSN